MTYRISGITTALVLASSLGAFSQAQAAPSSCSTVRFADVGWTDITATTALTSVVLESLGYDTKTKVLSVPVTYRGLANNDIDVFLGNWMPTMAADIANYSKAGTVDTVRANLEGAKYTLAVPQYVHEAGVKTFADVAANADRFKGRIYGIEAGNDGNRLIQNMIDQNAFGMGDMRLVESSEAGMLSQVRRAVKRDNWIVLSRLGATSDEQQQRSCISCRR